MRTRYAHGITAASLHILQHQSYEDYLQEIESAAEKLIFETCSVDG